MTPRYFAYLSEEDDERHDVSDMGRMVAFMQKEKDGEFFVSNYSGIKIKYDSNTGDVSPVSTEKRAWITYVFSAEAFQSIIAPVREAISLLAKMDMLLQLEKYDPEIKRIVQKRHAGASGELVNITLPAVEETLRQIVRLVAPANDRMFTLTSMFSTSAQPREPSSIYSAIYNALNEGKLYAIHSLKDVEAILQEIKQPESGSQAGLKAISRLK